MNKFIFLLCVCLVGCKDEQRVITVMRGGAVIDTCYDYLPGNGYILAGDCKSGFHYKGSSIIYTSTTEVMLLLP